MWFDTDLRRECDVVKQWLLLVLLGVVALLALVGGAVRSVVEMDDHRRLPLLCVESYEAERRPKIVLETYQMLRLYLYIRQEI